VWATLAAADDALVCVAFAQSRGVHLVADELTGSAKRGGARVVVTTTLGTSTEPALTAITESGAALRVLNPGGATYHPKVFLGRSGRQMRAVVGSANLTSGLVANVEAAIMMAGTLDDVALATLWSWAESVWSDPRATAWKPEPTD
jgi:HKD family nuclease